MKFLYKIFFLLFFFGNSSFSSENNTLRYIDLNYVINESIAGKEIIKKLETENSKKISEFSKIEKQLAENKKKVLSQKNILSKEEFEKKVIDHQEKLSQFQVEKKKNFDELNKKRLNLTNLLLKKIDKILLDYSKENSVSMILKKEFLIISNSNLDITNDILQLVNKNIKNLN